MDGKPRSTGHASRLAAAFALVPLLFLRAAGGTPVDLSDAVICVPSDGTPAGLAADLLRQEIARRTRIRLPVSSSDPHEKQAAIRIATVETRAAAGDSLPAGLSLPQKPEAYALWVDLEARPAPTVYILGRDDRGTLYGAGRLLRKLEMERDRLRLDPGVRIATAPRYPLRGHQIGYRPKTNAYDGWSVELWEQYLRDLVVFGANAVELTPPRSDDDDDSPHHPLQPLEMMVEMSRLAARYQLALWIWYPVLDEDRVDDENIEEALRDREEVFRALPRIDAIFVPGGDPGEVHPRQLLPLMEQQKRRLNRYHPDAQMWVSPQGYDWDGKSVGWLEEFYEILKRDEPGWLDGVVFGPQVRDSLAELRRRLPARYPIRRYPDITHCLDAQYGVPDWDPAFLLTLYREPINPRPLAYGKIFRDWDEYTVGFITYSEGVNDDVNKVVWSCLGWDPETRIEEILRDYARYFIGGRHAEHFAEGLLGLERNWQGPVLGNVGIYETLRLFQELEDAATPQQKLNWRFQLALYRAYYDAYTRRRLIHETELEEKAMDLLRGAKGMGALRALKEAEAILDRAARERVAPDWRSRTFEMAEALFQSIRMQLSVERYAAKSTRRGANLDLIDTPLNDSVELKKRFRKIRKLRSEKKRLRQIAEITRQRYRMKLEHDRRVIRAGIQ